MSRSRRKTPIVGHTTCGSEREDKKLWHQRWRTRERTALTSPAMRIAVPVSNDRTAETLSGIEGFQFFEDDHGRIVRRFFVPRAGEGVAAAVAQLEPYGVDALVCGALPGDERLETAAAGILLFPTFSGTPEEAALAFLGGTVARDLNNKCNACGFQSSCSLSGKGGCGRD